MSEPAITPEILELILRTSRVKGCSNLYALAPRGHRVGIYFQQRRATLLAAAIRSRVGREALRTCRIGIVGGGASGLTFLLAIQNEGAERAFLYEATKEIIGKGANASHRLVHPNYNRWPMLGSMDVFTSLPVLNWHAAPADKVVAQLRAEISAHYPELVDDRVFLEHRVKVIAQRSAALENPLQIRFKAPNGAGKDDFRIVVIAAGYGDEASTALGFNDYWTHDPGNWDVEEHRRACTVYGTGDGALIDLVKSCARNPVDAWLLPLGAIARIRPAEASTIVKGRTGEISPRPTLFSPMEKKIQAHEESIRSIAWSKARHDAATGDAYTSEEEAFYRSCIKELKHDTGHVLKFIGDRLKPVASGAMRPVLVGEHARPFEPTSAPINKLLLAYLIETGRIEYRRLDRVAQGAEIREWRNLSALKRSHRIVICRYGAAKNFPSLPGARAAIKVTVQPEGEISETSGEAELIDALSGMTGGEYVYFDAMPHPLLKARYGVDADGVTQETRERNGNILRLFAAEHLAADNVTFVEATKEAGPRWVVMTALTDDQITQKLKDLGGLDGNFFGAPITVVTPKKAAGGNL